MFGQVLMGLPGSGKSTYISKMSEYLKNDNRDILFINLDSGCDFLPYEPDIDIREIITINDVKQNLKLGPNMSMVYVAKFLFENKEWLKNKIISSKKDYVMIDFPGQVELFSHYSEVKDLIKYLSDPTGLNLRLVSVFMINSINCEDISSYLHMNITNLQTMLHIPIPTINLINLMKGMDNDKLLMQVKAYEDVNNIKYLIELDQTKKSTRYAKYRNALADFICDQPWLSYTVINFEDKESLYEVSKLIDTAGGYYVKKFENNDTNIGSTEFKIDDKDAEDFVKDFF